MQNGEEEEEEVGSVPPLHSAFVILHSAFLRLSLRLLAVRLDLAGLFELAGGGALDLVAAELVSQAGGDAGGEVDLVAAGEAGEQSRCDHRHGRVRLQGGVDGPASLAAVLDVRLDSPQV